MRATPIARLLLLTRDLYLDATNAAAAYGRFLLECLAKRGFSTEVLCGSILSSQRTIRAAELLPALGLASQRNGGATPASAQKAAVSVNGVAVTVHQLDLAASEEGAEPGENGFLAICEAHVSRFRPDVLIASSSDSICGRVLALGKRRGIATALAVLDLGCTGYETLALADAVITPCQFIADYYLRASKRVCAVLPVPSDDRHHVQPPEGRQYATLIDPSYENGVYAFARVADEVGRLRPEIPFLVVEGQGTEATLASCGVDLRPAKNVNVMATPIASEDIWATTRLAFFPSVAWQDMSPLAAQAVSCGIPVLASARSGLSELLDGRCILPLPERMTADTRDLPLAAEVAPWVEAIVGMWSATPASRSAGEPTCSSAPERDAREAVERCVGFFSELRPGRRAFTDDVGSRDKWVVLVPFHQSIDWHCERGLRALESEGVRVVRCHGASAIDRARNVLSSEAVHRGCERLMFIDSDIGFDPLDALRLLARPEPVIAGIYPKKGSCELASKFDASVTEVAFGPGAPKIYPLRYAGAGFLRIKTEVLQRMVSQLRLPLCHSDEGAGFWPFFQPMVVHRGNGRFRYLNEDWAFSQRLLEIGVTPMADASIRLFHIGPYGYSWEEAAAAPNRCQRMTFHLREGEG